LRIQASAAQTEQIKLLGMLQDAMRQFEMLQQERAAESSSHMVPNLLCLGGDLILDMLNCSMPSDAPTAVGLISFVWGHGV